MDDDIQLERGIEWINARERFNPPPKIEPQTDELVSKIVGKKIYAQDPRLIRLIVKWKREMNKPQDSKVPDNFLNDPEKVKELKEVLGRNL